MAPRTCCPLPPPEALVAEFLLRWLHFLAGITWIGLLYYFNFVQGPFMAEADAATKSAATQKLVRVSANRTVVADSNRYSSVVNNGTTGQRIDEDEQDQRMKRNHHGHSRQRGAWAIECGVSGHGDPFSGDDRSIYYWNNE